MKKRLMSILLATAILLGSLPITAMAATNVLRPGTVGTLAADGVQIEKYAEPTGNANEYLITLEALGKNIVVGSSADIVLVVDTSNSMDDVLADRNSKIYRLCSTKPGEVFAEQ